MDITEHKVTIRELVEGYKNSEDEGVVGYGGRLNIRPPYQREFVYEDKEKIAVINSIFSNFPLNVMYWVKNKEGGFELLDGQQRTLSICYYYSKTFMVDVDGVLKHFGILSEEQRNRFLDYKLNIYICENGTHDEQLKWFEIINIAGQKLTKQELRNAIYSGPWISDAKRRFSKDKCVAQRLGGDYMDGSPIRQSYLETVLKWISGDKIEEYMATHQEDANADREWQYFDSVITWVRRIFPKYRKEMKGMEWGELYYKYKDKELNATELEQIVAKLMQDSDVKDKKGIYRYVLSGEEKFLNIRAFDSNMKREAYERQKGICKICGEHFEIEEMEADHITPWSQGGHTVAENCQMLCRHCNRVKSNH